MHRSSTGEPLILFMGEIVDPEIPEGSVASTSWDESKDKETWTAQSGGSFRVVSGAVSFGGLIVLVLVMLLGW